MPKRIAVSNLNASTIDILNVIRANASEEYQGNVPEIKDIKDIPKVGEVLYGYPALSNQFINALINRIAAVRIESATFNNQYAKFKKGYLEFGEIVEEVFVGITKAVEFSVDKAEAREFKRTLPNVKTAFHSMNYRTQYPITIQNEDLRTAFLSSQGVTDLIARIVDAVYVSAQYDEFLLFKYLLIKAISGGKMYPIAVDTSDMQNSAIAFRGVSNKLGFMSNKYNAEGVTTTTPKADQYIFMDTEFNAKYDVSVLASAFNMDKADFMGKLELIDDFTSFDSERFSVIIENSDMMSPITDEELALMKDVRAVLLDKEWFQVYDNVTQFTEKYVASGMYWNYFYNVWKTVSSSPFSNAIVFVDSAATTLTPPETITAMTTTVSVAENGLGSITFTPDDVVGLGTGNVKFVQTQELTELGVAVHPYGAYLFDFGLMGSSAVDVVVVCEVLGTQYAVELNTGDLVAGSSITLQKVTS